jgi:membrane-associated phospholipid phosphatase
VICPHVPGDGTLAYHADLMALRSGTLGPLVFRAMTGVVTFPSFHTALAILVIYAIARTPIVAWPVILLNLLVIAATMPLGGHYLADVLCGGAIAVLSIHLVRLLNRRQAPDILPGWPAIGLPAGIRQGA